MYTQRNFAIRPFTATAAPHYADSSLYFRLALASLETEARGAIRFNCRLTYRFLYTRMAIPQ